MCSIAARVSANALKIAIHDAHVDVSLRRMLEGAGEPPDNLKAKALPQPHGTLIGADHEIVLHGATSALPRAVQRIRAHRPGHAAARRLDCGHIAAIGDVRSATPLVRLQAVGSDDVAIFFRDENLTLDRTPVRERALFVHVARQAVSLACPDDGLHDRPDRVRISVDCRPDQHPRILPRLLANTHGPPIGSGARAIDRDWPPSLFNLPPKTFPPKHNSTTLPDASL